MKWNSRTRCALVCLAFAGLFSAFSFRLVYLQMIKHDEYAGLAAEKHVYRQTIYAERGSILDANGEVLADNIPGETVVADATHVTDAAALTPVLAELLQLSPNELSEKLTGERRYLVLKREVPLATTAALRQKLLAQKLQGIYFERDSTRVYPNGSMLCHVIGFTDFDHRGIQGVESSMEDYLHGEDGYRFIEHNRAGQEIVLYRGQERAPRDVPIVEPRPAESTRVLPQPAPLSTRRFRWSRRRTPIWWSVSSTTARSPSAISPRSRDRRAQSRPPDG